MSAPTGNPEMASIVLGVDLRWKTKVPLSPSRKACSNFRVILIWPNVGRTENNALPYALLLDPPCLGPRTLLSGLSRGIQVGRNHIRVHHRGRWIKLAFLVGASLVALIVSLKGKIALTDFQRGESGDLISVVSIHTSAHIFRIPYNIHEWFLLVGIFGNQVALIDLPRAIQSCDFTNVCHNFRRKFPPICSCDKPCNQCIW